MGISLNSVSGRNKRALIIILHIAVWACFILVPFIFQPQPKALPAVMANHFKIVLLTSSIYLIAFYYINTQLLIPKLLFTRQWGWYIFSIIALFIAFLYLPEWVASLFGEQPSEADFKIAAIERAKSRFADSIPPNMPHKPSFGGGRNRFRFFPGSYLIFILVFAISTCISVMQQWLKTEEHKKEIEREKLNTELQFLKSQVNPHFFFNTLNNIYSLAVTGSDQTATAILKLSAIMRYIISDAQSNLVPLENEIAFINDFIHLQLVRLTDKVVVQFTSEGDVGSKMIAPLIFIPFVENAFKYGVSTKEKSTITFHMQTSDKRVLFSASNKIVQTENKNRETTGIGINNVKRRLDLLYPNKHRLQIFNTDQTFSIQLEITLK
ncbi:sensor histidine kinase [Parasediminibacterium sp. JCM 36343]|uniref:sensor histidine kinase n=1 Tax=Parasediminibacterium sp. JCM 36343 TaxID=3374279 RepID=UPI00397C7856